MATTLKIRQHSILRTRLPYGGKNCTDEFLETQPETFFNGQYSFQACRKNCIHSNLLENCGCIDEISTVRNVGLCKILDEDDVKCVENVRNSVFNSHAGGVRYFLRWLRVILSLISSRLISKSISKPYGRATAMPQAWELRTLSRKQIAEGLIDCPCLHRCTETYYTVQYRYWFLFFYLKF